ncbi:MAG: hypothetical protein ABI604_18805 [Nitrospirota bacterium]
MFHGPRGLARSHADGWLIETEAELRRWKDPTPRSRARPGGRTSFGARLKESTGSIGQIMRHIYRMSELAIYSRGYTGRAGA